MKFILILILLSGSYCSICSSASIQNTQNPQCPQLSDKIQIHNISIECQLLILEVLDIYDLISVAQTDQHFSILSSDVFRRRYSTKSFSILPRYGRTERNTVEITESNVLIKDFKMALSIFSTFGHLIQNLTIEYTFIEYDQRKELQNVIYKHCSNSLKSIQLRFCDENVLPYFQYPLQKVENLTITGELSSSNSKLMLNEIFPNLRSLYLKEIRISPHDTKLLDVLFSKLEHFSTASLRIPFLELAIIHGLFKRNPQIQSITLIDCHSSYYPQVIAEYIPNLISLNIVWNKVRNDYTGDKIHFSKVKQLRMKEMYFDYSEIMTFGQLEELEIECIEGECVDFATKYRNLTKLSIEQFYINDTKITEIGEKLTKLEEFSLKTESKIKTETIMKLIERSDKMEKFYLDNGDLEILDVLTKYFTKGWNITKSQTAILIERI